mmetsp:Transcript_90320/g.206587  ORF Transcript_90320/g.206587 Transcript_90320/m.206587 type:complete len:587 (+) Transcript_90320:1263-3023(+)
MIECCGSCQLHNVLGRRRSSNRDCQHSLNGMHHTIATLEVRHSHSNTIHSQGITGLLQIQLGALHGGRGGGCGGTQHHFPRHHVVLQQSSQGILVGLDLVEGLINIAKVFRESRVGGGEDRERPSRSQGGNQVSGDQGFDQTGEISARLGDLHNVGQEHLSDRMDHTVATLHVGADHSCPINRHSGTILHQAQLASRQQARLFPGGHCCRHHFGAHHVILQDIRQVGIIQQRCCVDSTTGQIGGERVVGGGEDRERPSRSQVGHQVGLDHRGNQGGKVTARLGDLHNVGQEHLSDRMDHTVATLHVGADHSYPINRDGPGGGILHQAQLAIRPIQRVHLRGGHVGRHGLASQDVVLHNVGQLIIRQQGGLTDTPSREVGFERFVCGGEERVQRPAVLEPKADLHVRKRGRIQGGHQGGEEGRGFGGHLVDGLGQQDAVGANVEHTLLRTGGPDLDLAGDGHGGGACDLGPVRPNGGRHPLQGRHITSHQRILLGVCRQHVVLEDLRQICAGQNGANVSRSQLRQRSSESGVSWGNHCERPRPSQGGLHISGGVDGVLQHCVVGRPFDNPEHGSLRCGQRQENTRDS